MVAQIEIFPWNETFKIGIPEIDHQHKQLIGLLNQLVSHLAFRSDAPTLNEVFDQLKDYALLHFHTEESIWHQHFPGDPWETSHQRAHASFVDEVLRIKATEETKPLDGVVEDVVSFLTSWLAYHILESDKRLAKVVIALPSGMSLEQAKELANNEMSGATKVLIDTVMAMYDNLAHRTVQLTREINKRRVAEQDLELANLVYHNISDCILVTDADNRIVAINPAFTQTMGYTLEEIQGKNPKVFGLGRHDEVFFKAMWDALDSSGRWQGELWNRRKNGEECAVSVTIDTIFDEKGKVHRRVALCADITDRKRRDEVLELARQTADAASRAKSEFLANMSHEIRTPINVIIGLALLLGCEIKEALQIQQLAKIKESARHLLSIINDILDLSKIEAGKLTLEEKPTVIGNIMENVASMLADRAKEKNLQLIVVNETLLHKMLGDPTRIQQALLNYANNAIKFTEKGTVTMRTQKLEETDDSILLRFEVEDTGIGLDEEAQARLFNAFEQADNSTTRKYGGTGLGLTINKKIAQLMGGEVGVKSAQGEGSRFWFTARLKKDGLITQTADVVVTESAEKVLLRDYPGCLILVVEDEPVNLEVTQMLLEEVGLSVDFAENGLEAIEKVMHNEFKLVLMDMQMPIMDGLEATRQLRKLPNGTNIPIIAMTANAFTEDKQHCFDAGMDDFVSKPVLPEDLYATLLKWLSYKSGAFLKVQNQ